MVAEKPEIAARSIPADCPGDTEGERVASADGLILDETYAVRAHGRVAVSGRDVVDAVSEPSVLAVRWYERVEPVLHFDSANSAPTLPLRVANSAVVFNTSVARASRAVPVLRGPHS